jgi:hypothetical protein
MVIQTKDFIKSMAIRISMEVLQLLTSYTNTNCGGSGKLNRLALMFDIQAFPGWHLSCLEL